MVNLHRFYDKPFDEGTALKLEIMENYLESWLPVFIHLVNVHKINIFDFFCGPGEDASGKPGSPKLLVDVVRRYAGLIVKKDVKVFVRLNDIHRQSYENVRGILDGQLQQNVKYSVDCLDYKDFLGKYQGEMASSECCNFLFIDPFGLVAVDFAPRGGKSLEKT